MNETEKICEWVYDRLYASRSVSKADFLGKFATQKPDGTVSPDEDRRVTPNWNRAVHAIRAVLRKQGESLEIEGNRLFFTDPPKKAPNVESLRYTTDRFQPNIDTEAKEKIGELIAEFLSKPLMSAKTIFLGSGSTIFHVGMKMADSKRHYHDQRFMTVNIPLAAAWCERDPPINKVSIPAAVLDTQTFRFSTMPEGLSWPLTVSIVAADGCFPAEGKKGVVLYGNDESVATNTSLFVQNTRHSVLFCLTSKKIEKGFAKNPNTGPPIQLPKAGVIRVLVTDKRYEKAVQAFENDGWMIVAADKDWDEVLETMDKGENTPV